MNFFCVCGGVYCCNGDVFDVFVLFVEEGVGWYVVFGWCEYFEQFYVVGVEYDGVVVGVYMCVVGVVW